MVIVAVASRGVTEVARHRRGEPYGYVISQEHKDPTHPSGPLIRHPIATNPAEAAFLGISADAAAWLGRAAGQGAARISSSMEMLVAADPACAKRAVARSLALDDFRYATVSALLARAKRVPEEPGVAEAASLGGSTKPYAKLSGVS